MPLGLDVRRKVPWPHFRVCFRVTFLGSRGFLRTFSSGYLKPETSRGQPASRITGPDLAVK